MKRTAKSRAKYKPRAWWPTRKGWLAVGFVPADRPRIQLTPKGKALIAAPDTPRARQDGRGT